MMLKSILFSGAILLCTSAAFGANIVLNPGFETGDFTSWTEHTCTSINCGAQGFFVVGTDPHTGSFAAETRCVSASCLDPVVGDWISQPLTTTASTAYTFSFWMDPVNSSLDPTVEIDVFWNSNKVGSFVSEPGGYHQFIIGGLVASGSTSLLELTGRHDPATVYIDDICVSSSSDCGTASVVPEPTALLLMSSGLAGIGIFALRRRRVGRS
jgi:hypothetical protein